MESWKGGKWKVRKPQNGSSIGKLEIEKLESRKMEVALASWKSKSWKVGKPKTNLKIEIRK